MKQCTYNLGGVFGPEAKYEIESTLSQMESIRSVSVDSGLGQVQFQFDPGSISEEFIKNTMNSLGYSILSD